MQEKTSESHKLEYICLFYSFYLKFKDYINIPNCANKDLDTYLNRIRNSENIKQASEIAKQALDFHLSNIDFPACVPKLNQQLQTFKSLYKGLR